MNKSFLVILSFIFSIIIVGCAANRPTYILVLETNENPPAVLKLGCGHVYTIWNENGKEIFNDRDPKYKNAYPGKIKLAPATYTIEYGTHFYKTYTLKTKATLRMEAAHLYRFARYSLAYKNGWLWIEDWTTSEVAAGVPPPNDVEKEWQGLWSYYCPSIALDYLK
ncbi:MAG: hypothetical protein ABW072_12135 [Sedimenticola sp.]